MKYILNIILITGVMFYSGVSFADIFKPSGEFALYKDAKVQIRGIYEGYYKYFSERDLNGFNGNYTAIDPVTGETRYTHTDMIERWSEHELNLYPGIYFNDNLEFHLRLTAGNYIFQGDAKRRLHVDIEDLDDGEMYVFADNEKLRLIEAYVEMTTPVGLFIFGRFQKYRHGIAYGAYIPWYPEVKFGLAWAKSGEGKLDYETDDIYYYETKARDYLDRDDRNFAFLYIGYGKDELYIRHDTKAQLHDSKASIANTALYVPQLKIWYDKGSFHLFLYGGFGTGTAIELGTSSFGPQLQQLLDGQRTISDLRPELRPSANIEPMQTNVIVTPANSLTYVVKISYDIGDFTPFVSYTNIGGADSWNQISGLAWDDDEPKAYKLPRNWHTLLFREIEDKYFSLINTYGSVYVLEDLKSFVNMKILQVGTSYRISDKLEFLGHIFAAQRESVEYAKSTYWDLFPLAHAMTFQNVEDNGVIMAPIVVMKNNVNYYTPVDPFIGVEFHGNLTYQLFDGFNVSLLFSYFKAGDFYKDVLTPKEYVVQYVSVDADTQTTLGNQYTIKGPYLGADEFEFANAWSIQFKIDFKFEVPL